MKLISIGKLDIKFLLYTFIYLLVILLLNISSFILNYKKFATDNIPGILIITHCSLLFYIIPHFLVKKSFSDNNKQKNVKKDNNQKINYLVSNSEPFSIKQFLILVIMLILEYIYDAGLIYFQKENENESELVFGEIFKFMDTLYLFIFFRKFHKIIFYRHQYISLFIIILMGLIKFSSKILFIFILDSDNKTELDYFKFYLLSFILVFPFIDSINIYFLQKYIVYKYYSPYFICFLIGIIYLIISVPIFFIFHDKDNSGFIKYLSSNIDLTDTSTIITIIFYSIFYSLYHFVKLLIIDKFSIFHLIFIVTCGEVINNIYEQISSNFNIYNLIITLVTYCFEIIGVLVFIEKIELNFCGLNSYLKKNIIFRAGNELKEIYKVEKGNENDLTYSSISEESYLNQSNTQY